MIKLNGFEIKPTMFPDKTSQVWKIPPEYYEMNCYSIEWGFESEAELIYLAQLSLLLQSIPGWDDAFVDLTILYLPYGRQDKAVSNNNTFALHAFAKILNSLNFKQVTIIDPHSQVALDIIENSEAIYPIDIVKNIFDDLESDVLAYPDKGAVSKYKNIYKQDYVYGEKVRDQSSGLILSYELVGEVKDKSILICDDIADGGATFVFLAEALLKAGAKEVNLFVTHGIFSRGLRLLHEVGIKRIFTKDGEVLTTTNG